MVSLSKKVCIYDALKFSGGGSTASTPFNQNNHENGRSYHERFKFQSQETRGELRFEVKTFEPCFNLNLEFTLASCDNGWMKWVLPDGKTSKNMQWRWTDDDKKEVATEQETRCRLWPVLSRLYALYRHNGKRAATVDGCCRGLQYTTWSMGMSRVSIWKAQLLLQE